MALALLLAIAGLVEAEEYWGTAPESNVYEDSRGPGYLYLFNDGPASPYDVQSSSGTLSSGTVPAGGLARAEVTEYWPDGSTRTSTTAFVVHADRLAVDHFPGSIDMLGAAQDSTRILPYGLLGRNHTIATLEADIGAFVEDQRGQTAIAIVAPRDGITVTATVTADVEPQVPFMPGGVPAMTAGSSWTWTLDRFEAILLHSDGYLAGSRIEASAPVAVFTSTPAAVASGGPNNDIGFEQQLPDELAGRLHVVCASTPHRMGGLDHIQVTGIEPATTLRITPGAPGTTYTIASAGQTLWLKASRDHVITSDKPVWIHVWSADEPGYYVRERQAADGGPSDWLVPPLDRVSNHALWGKYVEPSWPVNGHYMLLATHADATVTASGKVLSGHTIPGTEHQCIRHTPGSVTSYESTGPLAAAYTVYDSSREHPPGRHDGDWGSGVYTDCSLTPAPAPVAPVLTGSNTGSTHHLRWMYPAGAHCITGYFEVALLDGTVLATTSPYARSHDAQGESTCSSTAYTVRFTDGPWSAPAWINITNPPSTRPIAVELAVDGLNLSWDAAPFDPCGVLRYDVFEDGAFVGSVPVHQTRFRVAPMEVCSTKTWSVAAANDAGRGPITSATFTDQDCPSTPVASSDSDGDGAPDGMDNCEGLANPAQSDSDANGIGDACDEPLREDPEPEEHLMLDCELALPHNTSMNASMLRWSYEEDCPVTGFTIWTDAPVAVVEHTDAKQYLVPRPESQEVFIQVETGAPLPELVQGRYVRVEATAETVGPEDEAEPDAMTDTLPPAKATASTKQPDAVTGTIGLIILLAAALLLVLRRRKE